MSFARTDSQTIASSLEEMKRLVIARGGAVHPAAVIEEQGGSLRVVCDSTSAVCEPLFVVPDELLVPVDCLDWTQNEKALELASSPSELSRDQADLLALFVTIYNATGKINWIQNQAARILSRDDEFASQLAMVRPGCEVSWQSAAATFMGTRTYASEHASAGLADKNCVLPLIDFMNHNLEGSRFWHGGGNLKVDIANFEGTDECFVNYGKRRDPLGLALSFGYLDSLSPFALSVPVSLDLGHFGLLEVVGIRVFSSHPSDPPKLEFTEEGVILSHLAGDKRAPHELRAKLRLAMLASGKRRGVSDTVIERALAELPSAILAENRKKLSAFRAYLATRPELPLASLLSDASQCQLANLERIFAA